MFLGPGAEVLLQEAYMHVLKGPVENPYTVSLYWKQLNCVCTIQEMMIYHQKSLGFPASLVVLKKNKI